MEISANVHWNYDRFLIEHFKQDTFLDETLKQLVRKCWVRPPNYDYNYTLISLH